MPNHYDQDFDPFKVALGKELAMKKAKKSKSGQTSAKIAKTAAAFLAMNDDERFEWLSHEYNIGIVAGWAASVVNQSPNRKNDIQHYDDMGFDPRDGSSGKPERAMPRKKKAAKKKSRRKTIAW